MSNNEAIYILEEVKELDDSMYQYNTLYMDALELAIEALRSQETGVWKKKTEGNVYWYECSKCGTEPLRCKWNGDWKFTNYCPWCGAKLECEPE